MHIGSVLGLEEIGSWVLLSGLVPSMVGVVNAVDTLLIFYSTIKTKSFLTPASEIVFGEDDIT